MYFCFWLNEQQWISLTPYPLTFNQCLVEIGLYIVKIKLTIDFNEYCTRAIITLSWLETAPDFRPTFLWLVYKLFPILTALDFKPRECIRNLDLQVQVHPGELWVSKQRVHIVLEASKSAGAKGDVPKILVHPLPPWKHARAATVAKDWVLVKFLGQMRHLSKNLEYQMEIQS